MRRTRRIYKRKTRSNLETLIILVGAIVILSIAFYMAREKSFLPPEKLESEQQTISREEMVKVGEEEQREIDQLIAQDIPNGERPTESEAPIPQKPVEREVSSQTTEQMAQKESDLVSRQTVTTPTPPKQEVSVSQTETVTPSGTVYTIQVGYFSIESNARDLAREIENRGFQTFVIEHNKAFKVQVGAYSLRAQAEEASQQLKRMGYETWITQR
ncbi:MAG: SPOR domain-containing protein [Atribacterota bacterium]|nr:SPOR domain-containing protein [Atribacterota bacterium]MDD4895291.1 SPOR domain-containing protein [Atribacterota bacterium]MDD5636615.1 SPOR domain-containing protein [Atribacterota bacterium]